MTGRVYWMTGLPGAGKTTLAKAMAVRLLEQHGVEPEILDGDEIRAICPTGFTPEDRERHLLRTAHTAALLAKRGVTVIVATISPMRKVRARCRLIVETLAGPGRWSLLHLATPMEWCKEHHPNRLYQRAEMGEIENLTGVSAPYELPEPKELAYGAVLRADLLEPDRMAQAALGLGGTYRRRLLIGRWQPLHNGHVAMIRRAMQDGPVAVGIRRTPMGPLNPYSVSERREMIEAVFGDKVEVFEVPDCEAIGVGRAVGYDLVDYSAEVNVPVSATAIRQSLGDGTDGWKAMVPPETHERLEATRERFATAVAG